MPMNLVILEKRKELGLTQEQVAEYLHVSIPAVSKWEKGLTSPDISLLPPLARLLKIDLNTLFCFQENLSDQEIGFFSREVAAVVQEKGIAAGFERAEQKIREYPHNETLLHCLAFLLDGLLVMAGLPADEKNPYDDRLFEWYDRLARSRDEKISNSADYMLVSRYIRKNNYDKAQEILDLMPEKEDVTGSMADKRMLQVTVYLRQGRAEEAVKCLQNALLAALNKAQMLLCRMVGAELASGEIQTAKSIADKAGRMAVLSDFWEYHSFTAPLQVAMAEKNAEECIRLLEKLLAAMLTPWDMSSSPLFYRIAKTSDPKQMLPAVLSEMEQDAAYDFLRNRDEFRELISRYKKLAEDAQNRRS